MRVGFPIDANTLALRGALHDALHVLEVADACMSPREVLILLDSVIKEDLIKTHEFLDADASKLGTHFQPVPSVCKQHWTVSLHNLDCQYGPMIQQSIY